MSGTFGSIAGQSFGLVRGPQCGLDVKNRLIVSGDTIVLEANKVHIVVDGHVHERFLSEFGVVRITILTNGYAYLWSNKMLLLHI
jgi:hypothetical protein